MQMKIGSPLFTRWTEQYVTITVPGLEVGSPQALKIDGSPAQFQYTGKETAGGAEIMLRLSFEQGQMRTLEFEPTAAASTDLSSVEIPCENGAEFGVTGHELRIGPLGTFLTGCGGFALESSVRCKFPLVQRSLARLNDGPFFIDYELKDEYERNHSYAVKFRCYRHEPIVEVAETLALDMDSELVLAFNPGDQLDSIISHDGPEFEGEAQPHAAPLSRPRPKDVLCRLQMPVLSEYFIPNNRGWFAFFDSRNESRGMIGILGLYGGRWERPVDNIMRVYGRDGRAELHASLFSGRRYWLLYAGPFERSYTPERRFVFHRLHAEFNAIRLDEHLDLTGESVWDASCWNKPGFFGDDYRGKAKRNAAALTPLRKAAEQKSSLTLQALLEPTSEHRQALLADIMARFEKWVRDFQGFREGHHDYAKNVIGFSRRLRALMLAYELLRKDEALATEQVHRLNAYFAFAARRIMDEGRWPHSRTWKHPDHPESTRDLYTYPGEHKPDKLVWTNCLPNFQSDPICALINLSSLIPDHPDAGKWLRYAQDDMERQLDAYCGDSGAWEESINYALYTFSYFVITFRILKNRWGIDYFNDSRMRKYAAWLVRFFGPLDKRFNAYTYPAIGNSVLPQLGGEYLLAYAGELAVTDPLRADLISVYQKQDQAIRPGEHSPLMLAAMAPIPEREYPLRPLSSEHMDDLGVAMRHEHPGPRESYLFQKIGFWKDHYEHDESSFNWYAKGTPLVMDYGTYTGDAGTWAAHNLIEIPDMDALRRGYLAQAMFTPMVDYTHCELPVTLKLSYGRMRSFEEMDGPPEKPAFFYIGDENPVGPKTWKNRLLLFVKPDYVVIFDRVFGAVPHRYNLHVTADEIKRDGGIIRAAGRFDLDLLCCVQHPAKFEFETGEFFPGPQRFGEGAGNPHRQRYFRIYNLGDGIYRTLLFAQERDRSVHIEAAGPYGFKIITPEYVDYVFANDEMVYEDVGDMAFAGRVGWIRRTSTGTIAACVPDGDSIAGFGIRIDGRGPLHYNMDGRGSVQIDGVPREVRVSRGNGR